MTDSNKRRSLRVTNESPDIHQGGKLSELLNKAFPTSQDAERGASNQGTSSGVRRHLINKAVSRQLRDYNATHAICLDAKKASSLGLGHRDRDIHDALDPLTRFSWQDTLDALAEDFWETGECFLEVVYGEPGLITGLHHVESAQVHIEVEEHEKPEQFHFVVSGEVRGGQEQRMARWGELEETQARLGSQIANSEIIHIRQSTNRSRYYGYPDYMSAVPSIELVQCMTQHEFDFYFNRGVPEFLMFLVGNNITDESWDGITSIIKGSQGLGNSHKTGAIHIPGNPEDVNVQIEKLAMEDAANSGFSEKSATLDMRIATAHGMPPQLANIAVPGKMGAANEGPNAMLTFQQRKLGQVQKMFSSMFASTLGKAKLAQPSGESKSLTADMFLGKGAKPMDENEVPQFVQPGNGFNTILDGMTLGAQNTMASMREPLAGSGRNPDDGKLSGARDRKEGDPRATRGPGTGK